MATSESGKLSTHSQDRGIASNNLSGRPRVYFDIKIGDRDEGRVVFELVSRDVPNFKLHTDIYSSTMVRSR